MPDSSFGFKQPEASPGFLLWQTTVTWQRLIKLALDEYKISHAQFVILAVVLWFKEMGKKPTQSDVIKKTKLDKMTVSQALKKLSTEKLVRRRENTEDTRAKLVALTPRGEMLTKKLVPIVEAIDKQFFSTLNKKDRLSFIALLGSLATQ